MENRIVTEHGINEELAELRLRMARLEKMKYSKIRTGQMLGYEKEERINSLSFKFFLRLK